MSLKVCADCTAIYASDLCPHCGGGVYRFDWEEEPTMPKATVEGGPSGHSEGAPAEAAPEPRPVKIVPLAPKAPKPKPAPAAAGK